MWGRGKLFSTRPQYVDFALHPLWHTPCLLSARQPCFAFMGYELDRIRSIRNPFEFTCKSSGYRRRAATDCERDQNRC